MAETKKETENKAKFPKPLLIILIVIGVLVLLGSLLTFGTSLFVGKKILENANITTEDGGNTVTLKSGDDAVTVSNTQTWPTTMPSIVPKFTAGNINATSKIGEAWTVQISDVKSADLETYKNKLVSAGWVLEGEFSMNDTVSWIVGKDNYKLNATLSTEDGVLILTVTTTEALDAE